MYRIRDEYRMLLDEPDRKGVFGGHKRRWKYNIKTDIKKKFIAKLRKMLYGD
jgi:hypothetical protein